ncbi:MAG: aminotransferase class IV [Planctomycetes bacterium]|nr:aminotransferase class IV [Planctomycetota bacterium]
MSEPLAFLNGRYLPQSQTALPLHDAGFVLGATVTDLCRTFRQRLYRWQDHLARFRRSCQAAFLNPSLDDASLTAVAEELVAENAKLLTLTDELVLIVFTTPGPVGYFQGDAGGVGSGPATLGMHTFPLPFERYRPLLEHGARLIIPRIKHVPSACVDPHIKQRSRMHWWLADCEARQKDAGAMALLLDDDGFVTETASANLLAVRDNALVSPRLDRVLEGISLQVVRELCDELKIPFLVDNMKRDDLQAASEILLTSTPFCLAGVRLLDGHAIPWPGPMLRRLQEAWSQSIGREIAAVPKRND